MKSDLLAIVENTQAFKLETAPAPFDVVPIADLVHVAPEAPSYAWEGLIPFQHVTTYNAHGGSGKSTVMQMLQVAATVGQPLFGIPTTRCKTAFFSAEDGAQLLRYRLRNVCRGMGVSIEDLAGQMFILDATENDPTLYAEVTVAGRREGATTATYDALREFLRENGVRLLIVDNASDAYDANEIERAKVRGFMRSLAKLAREFDAAVVLLAHVDKNTSRGLASGSEAYSGSTAWHNSARSRLAMSRDKDGTLLLEQQKHNLGPLREPLRLIWPKDGLPQLDAPLSPVVQAIEDRQSTTAVLRLIDEFTARGEHVSTATTSRTHAGKLLRGQPGFPPRLSDPELFDLLRQAERRGLLERLTWKGTDRKERERWDVTPAGRDLAGLPPAATAATSRDFASGSGGAGPAEPAATAATSPPGGCGGKERAQGQRAGRRKP